MAYEVKMPRLGWGMEHGILVEWLKEEGEWVREGESLFSVENDKSVQEVEAMESGALRFPDPPAPIGEDIPVGTVIAYLLDKEE